jgi:hypothetical protein
MPADCEEVLTFSDTFGISTGHWNSGAWWVRDEWIEGVTHWMPLPEEPRTP